MQWVDESAATIPTLRRVFMSSPDLVGSTAHGRRVNLLQQSSFPSRGVWTGPLVIPGSDARPHS